MIIYLDIFFLENFIINLFLLYTTVQTLKIKINMLNAVLASVFGSIYSILAMYDKFSFIAYIPFKLTAALIMIIILIRKKNVLFNLKAMIIFILYSMVLAGMCMFIELNKGTKIVINFKGVSYKILFCALMLMYIVIHRIVVCVKDRKNTIELIYDVEIVTDKSSKKVRAFLDTGNELREPATNLPVMIVEKSLFKNINIAEKEKFIIPYRVVNGVCGKMEGFKPKSVKIYINNEIEDCEVIVAFCEDKLSKINDYNALLSRGIL